ncbi:pilus assembly protein [Marinomonas transparens]|uniref:Pilus assembly protein n=1 Tax=Marinomonas transparens TaxID=2795388 RepID=A0A934N0Z0_9GAMM|nr:pilus assembly protein [Marinomonas transparens]MBJ7536138.1 pilus assembly protein [Marinomonas transparens]
MKSPILTFLKKKNAVVSIEVALSFPVLLFIIMMFFELARIALIVTVVDFSLEKSMQEFRSDMQYYAKGNGQMTRLLTERVIANSFDMLSSEKLDVDLQSFDNLDAFSGEKNDSERYYKHPILSFNVLLKEDFITPLPSIFGLGESFQHEYKYILGDLIGVSES